MDVANNETREERIRRLMGGDAPPAGDEPVVKTTAAPATGSGEPREDRIRRLMGGGAADLRTVREVNESPEAYDTSALSPGTYQAPSPGAARSRFLAPISPRPLPEGMTAADPEESVGKAALRGGLRTLDYAVRLKAFLDPWAPLKRRYGVDPPERNLNELAGMVGVDLSEIQMEGGLARLGEKVGEEAVAGAAVAVPFFWGAKAAQGTALASRRWIGPLLRFPAERPGAFAAGEVAASVGAGGGRAVMPEGTGPQVTGALLGAVSPITLVPLRKMVTVPIGNLIKNKTVRGAPQNIRVRRKTGKKLMKLTGGTPETAEATIAKIEATEQLFAGSKAKPSLVQAARNEPGLLGFEGRRAGTGDPGGIALNKELTAQRMQTQEAIVEELDDLAQLNRFEGGEGSLLARAVENEPPSFDAKELVDAKLRARAEQTAAVMEGQIKESQERIHHFVLEQTRGGKSTNYSQILREELEAESDRVFAPFHDAYDDIDKFALSNGARVQNTELVKTYDSLLRPPKYSTAQGTGLPTHIEETLKTLTGKMKRPSRRQVGMGEYIPFHELRGLKKEINAAIRMQGVRPEGRTSVHKMGEIKDAINRTLDLAEDGGSRIRFVEGEGAARELVERPADAARLAQTYVSTDLSFSTAAERFRKGVTGQILEPQRGPPAATATAGLYIRPGKGKGQREAAESLARAAAESPELRKTTDDYLISLAWEATNHPEKGAVLANLRRFERNYAEALDVFPESAHKIHELDSLVAEAEKRQLAKVASLKNWEHSAAGRWLKTDDPRAAISGAVARGPGAVRKLYAQIGDAEGRRGFADIMWSEIQRKATRYGDLGPGTSLYIEPNAFHKMLDEWAPTVRVVSGQEQVTNLRRLANKAEHTYVGKVPESARDQQRSFVERMNVSFLYNRIFSFWMKIARGSLMGVRWIAKRDRGQMEALLDRALVDKGLGKEILREAATEAAQTAKVRRLRGSLISLGYRIPPLEEEQEEEQTQ